MKTVTEGLACSAKIQSGLDKQQLTARRIVWVPEKLVSLFEITKETVDDFKLENLKLRSENELLKTQLASNRIMTDWLRTRVNSLELEKAALMAKAFNINLPAPEIVRTERDLVGGFNLADLFAGPPIESYDDIKDE